MMQENAHNAIQVNDNKACHTMMQYLLSMGVDFNARVVNSIPDDRTTLNFAVSSRNGPSRRRWSAVFIIHIYHDFLVFFRNRSIL
jgi:hypothetical protein